MILNDDRLSWLPMEHWPIAYRFTEERYNKLPQEALVTIRPLADESARQLAKSHGLIELTRQAHSNLLSPDWESEEICEDDWDALRSWLRQRRPHADDVYVEWAVGGYCAAVVAWQTLCDYFDDFWYTFEILLVSDDTREWQILVGPNDVARWRVKGTSTVDLFPNSTDLEHDSSMTIDYGDYTTNRFDKNPKDVFDKLIHKDIDAIEAIKQIRKLYNLSLAEAMEAIKGPNP